MLNLKESHLRSYALKKYKKEESMLHDITIPDTMEAPMEEWAAKKSLWEAKGGTALGVLGESRNAISPHRPP